MQNSNGTVIGFSLAALIVAGLVGLNELSWISKSELAWPLIGLAISVGLVSIALIIKSNEK